MCKALGENTVIASATGCMEIVSSMFPTTAWEVPWIHVAFENAAAVASGVEAGLKALRKKGKIDDRYIKVVGMAGDGGTMDIGMQALSGAMERGHDMLFVCFDNEAYMNTGIQRSSGTPMGASTTTAPAGKISSGQKTWKKNMAGNYGCSRRALCGHRLPQLSAGFYPQGGKSKSDQRSFLHSLFFRMSDRLALPFPFGNFHGTSGG